MKIDELSDDARAVLGHEQHRPGAAPGVEARLLARLQASAAAVPSPTPSTAPGILTGAASKVLVGAALFALGGAVGGAVAWQRSQEVTALKEKVAGLEAELARAPIAVLPPEVAVAAPVPPPPAPLKPAPKRVREPLTPDLLSRENALLERARTALLRSDLDQAWTALQAHLTGHPEGRLSEERDALQVQVLVLLGRTDAARAAAQAFKVRYPKSLLGQSVDAAIDHIQ
jgi:hypothetical protein